MNFPLIIVDNFLENPDKVREIALSLEFKPNNGNYPGKRTEKLHIAYPELFIYLTDKLISVLFNQNDYITLDSIVQFQLIDKFSNNSDDPLNKGWIHQDLDCNLVGILYLSKNIDLNCGTNFYNLKDGIIIEDSEYDEQNHHKKNLYVDENVTEDYGVFFNKWSNKFNETVSVKSVYNRLVILDAKYWHAASNYLNADEQRLTATFFISNLGCNPAPPLVRKDNVKMEDYIK